MTERTADSPRLAILVSGQMRRINPIAENVARFSAYSPTVFASVWKARGFKTNGWLAPPQIHRILGYQIAKSYPLGLFANSDRLFGFLPEYVSVLEEFGRTLPPVSAEDFAGIDNVVVDIEDDASFVLKRPEIAHKVSTERLLYKMIRAFEMMERFEQEHGQRFTHVLRIRPDLVIDKMAARHDLDDKLYFDGYRNLDNPELAVLPGDNYFLTPRDDFESIIRGSWNDFLGQSIVDIHWLLGNQLKQKRHKLRIGGPVGITSDPWPEAEFRACLKTLAEREPDNELAQVFHLSLRANTLLDAGDHAGVIALVAPLPDRLRLHHGMMATLALAYHRSGQAAEAIEAARWVRTACATGDSNLRFFLHDIQPIPEA